MDLITVVIIGVIVATTGVINPEPKDPETVAKAPETQVTTPVVEAKPEPEPVKEPEPEPEPAKEPEPTPEPVKEPEPETKPEEPKEEVSAEPTQEQDAKPEEEEVTPVAEETTEAAEEEKGISMLNIILYILGAIAVIAAGIYFFMRREPEAQSLSLIHI
mgnify:CR=1 FL=1